MTSANIRLLYWDIAWFGVLFGVTANFLVVFVARLNASPWLLSAVTSGPALVNIMWQLRATRIVERSPNPHRLIVRAVLPQRLGFLVIALIPWLLPPAWQAYAVVAVLLVQGIPTAILAVAFSAVFAELVPRERMAAVVGMRNALLGLTSTLIVALCGVVLTLLPFPLNYQTILVLGFGASLGSLWCVARLRTTAPTVPAASSPHTAPRSALHHDHNYVRFVTGAGLLQLGMFMTAPLFPLYWVDTLHLGDGWVSIFATTLSLTSIGGALAVRRYGYRWRNSRLLGSSAVLFGLYPLLTSVLHQPWLLALAAGGAGLWAGVINVVLFNGLAEVCPPPQRARYMGVYTWLMNIAIFAGPLLGAALAGIVSIQGALLVAGAIRAGAGVWFWHLPFRAWEPATAPAPLLA